MRRPTKVPHPFYTSKPWFAVRAKVIARDRNRPCELCGKPILAGQKVHVDHRIPRATRPDLALNPLNLRAVHHGCHSSHTHTKATAIGIDGFPTDGSWS
jgi:5-methylcytosine-specific restriction endonuclease McrA